MTSGDSEWDTVVAEVAKLPGVAKKLMADHQPDTAGKCRSCTTPGRGTAHITWPCSMYRLGKAALLLLVLAAAGCGSTAPAEAPGPRLYPEDRVCGTVEEHPVRVPETQCQTLGARAVWYYTPLGAARSTEDYTPMGQPITELYLRLRDHRTGP